MKTEYIEKIYAGWLAKIIGIRMGSNIEGWTYEQIKHVYGELTEYPVNFKGFFAADDDSNGPLFFLRALEGKQPSYDLTAQDVGDALLNYAPFEHGFFWWGGYGISTEHTAYLNLRNGIPAPRSGSMAQNGSTMAEQIGGQIFIDTWGLVTPGNPDLAAKYAKQAASVTHDGNGIYGGMFIASCISHAFDERNIRAIIEKGLSYIPSDCEYTRVVRSVMAYYDAHPGNWRDGFQYVFENFGYDRYPGECHIIPNTAVMILSLLYGEGDFSDTLNICNMCGWDTDCNVGNIATIMGIICGLDAIEAKWRAPINDLLICSSVLGSMNILDIPYCACYIAQLAWAIAGEPLPDSWQQIMRNGIDSCHFEFPGSTHAMQLRLEGTASNADCHVRNTDEAAHSGTRSLRACIKPMQPGKRAYLYKKTYYHPEEFDNSRYDPCFSPLAYPGQTVEGSIMIPRDATDCVVRLYARNHATGELLEGEPHRPQQGEWLTLSFPIPALEDALIDEVGFVLDVCADHKAPRMQLDCFIDDLSISGQPHYQLNLGRLPQETWTNLHKEIAQFTRLKGLFFLEDQALHLSAADFAEAYTGHHAWTDYTAQFTLEPKTGARHFVNVRVQGAIRSYAIGLTEGNVLGLYKNESSYHKLAETPFPWTHNARYVISITARGAELVVCADGRELLRYTDTDNPYLSGCVGLSVQEGSHCAYHAISIK